MYKALIIDDEPMAREILETHLSKIDTINVLQSCKNANEAFNALTKHTIDLVFLDINMPDITGIMFARAIQGKTKVIFTTAYREYALDGFDLKAVDYLLKPISLERLMQAVSKFIEEHGATSAAVSEVQKFTFFKADRKMVKVDFDTITHLESAGDYVKIYLTNKTIVTRDTIVNCASKLPDTQFLRVHRSFMVNTKHIDSFTAEHINISKNAIPISRSYRDSILERLNTM